MTEDQVSVILQAIGDARQESTKAIGELSTKMAEFQGNIEARVDIVEDQAKTARRQGWILTYVVIPALSSLHALLAHFGIRV